jgi:hypothetical protein
MTQASGWTAVLGRAAERLRGPDMLQVLALFLAALLFVLAIRWPSAGDSNEAWFAVAQARMVLLALAALGYGAAESWREPGSRRSTAAAVMMFAVLSAPFDIATYAASYPAAPLWWAAGLPFPTTLAYYGLGLGLGRLATWARLGVVLPLLVPAVLVFGIWIDVRLGVSVFNPLAAPLAVSLVDGLVMVGLASATLVWLARARESGEAAA